MALRGNQVYEKIRNYFSDKGLNDYAIAGLLGNLYCESGLNPKNLQNSFERKLGLSDEKYTEQVDNGVYKNFSNDRAGYGLCQWTHPSRKKNLLKFANQKSSSIGDLEMQLDFLYKELSESYKRVWKSLQTAETVREASDIILLQFERPANQTEENCSRRASCGERFYEKFMEDVPMNDNANGKDNVPDEWAKEAVEWAVRNKILLGDAKGNYKLHNSCTRQEMLIFLNRLYKMVR